MSVLVKYNWRRSMSDKQRDYWSDCSHVFFLDGYGWGLTEKCQRIYLGEEENILRFFETGELNGNLHPRQKEVLNWILEYRKEQGFGEQSDDRTEHLDRRRPGQVTRHYKEKLRQPKKRKRTAIR
jgi:hypothetical protein